MICVLLKPTFSTFPVTEPAVTVSPTVNGLSKKIVKEPKRFSKLSFEAIARAIPPITSPATRAVIFTFRTLPNMIKIANNLIGMTLGVVLSEALSMGVKAGVDPMTLYDAISASTGNTAHMKSYPETLFKGNFDPGFKLDLAAKDVGLATDMGRKLRVPMKVSNLVQQCYIDAQNKGWGQESTLAIAKLQEEISGVKIRSEIK